MSDLDLLRRVSQLENDVRKLRARSGDIGVVRTFTVLQSQSVIPFPSSVNPGTLGGMMMFFDWANEVGILLFVPAVGGVAIVTPITIANYTVISGTVGKLNWYEDVNKQLTLENLTAAPHTLTCILIPAKGNV